MDNEDVPEIPRHCMNCVFWKRIEGQTQRPFWGACTATKSQILHHYIRPIPEKLETVELFGCEAFQPSLENARRAAELNRLA
jgi:hypothetical protein